MRTQLNNILRNGNSLTVADTDKEVVHYDNIVVLGGVQDSTTFTLINDTGESLNITLPGGATLFMPVKSVSVTSTTSGNAGILVRGWKQKKQIFGY